MFSSRRDQAADQTSSQFSANARPAIEHVATVAPASLGIITYPLMGGNGAGVPRVNQTAGGRIMSRAASRAFDEFTAGILANAASRCTASSQLRSATLACARRCAPSSVHRIY